MSETDRAPLGPYVVWADYGYEGWHHRSFPTLEAAIAYHGYGETLVITKLVKFEIKEIDGEPNGPEV